MTNLIVLKTDASFKHGVGSGISFETKVIKGGIQQQKFEDNRTIEHIDCSTDAELIAIIFGLKKVIEEMDNPDIYEISVNSDCEHSVDVFNEDYYKDNQFRKVALHFLDKFAGWRVGWIPRCTNEKADGLAKSALYQLEDEHA